MNRPPGQPRLRISSPAGVLAVVPHLLGFTPQNSLVVIGTGPAAGRVKIAFRYDLPDPPAADAAAQIAAHATGVLARQHLRAAVVAGYGPGPLVTPVADALRDAAARTGVELLDVLRVQDGRFWSYLCREPSCCPAEGVPFDAAAHPAAAVLTDAGLPVLASRAALAATIAPLTGPAADAMTAATQRAERVAARLTARAGQQALDGPGLAAVRAAIAAYRDGGTVSSPMRHAWLALVLTECGSGTMPGPGWTPPTATRTAGCGPTSSAGRSPATWPRPRPCWRSPPGRAATAPWRTSRSSARWPIPPATQWPCCSATPSTPARRRPWPPRR